jgi:hypothetical protein
MIQHGAGNWPMTKLLKIKTYTKNKKNILKDEIKMAYGKQWAQWSFY